MNKEEEAWLQECKDKYRLNMIEILKQLPEPNPPLTEQEITYLAEYGLRASMFEDGSDEGPWIENFLKHRQQLSRLV